MRLIICISIILMSTGLSGQQDESASFEELLRTTKVFFAKPLESFFKEQRVGNNSVIQFDYALKGKQDPVDIRYKIIPIPEGDKRALAPQVTMTTRALHMASNEEDASDMVFHRIQEEDLKPFNADFGLIVFFQPKDKISGRKHCKAQFLYAEGRGIICTFIFFDKTDIDLKPYEQNLSFLSSTM